MSSTEELREVEASCIAKFRRRAQELRQMNPGMTEEQARFEAVRSLPEVASRYHYSRNILSELGIPPLPVR